MTISQCLYININVSGPAIFFRLNQSETTGSPRWTGERQIQGGTLQTTSQAKSLLILMEECHLTQHIQEQTRINYLLDLVLTNSPDMLHRPDKCHCLFNKSGPFLEYPQLQVLQSLSSLNLHHSERLEDNLLLTYKSHRLAVSLPEKIILYSSFLLFSEMNSSS